VTLKNKEGQLQTTMINLKLSASPQPRKQDENDAEKDNLNQKQQ